MKTSRRFWLRLPAARTRILPPGARPDPEFSALCIRCSRCVEVCPYGTLVPAGWDHGVDAGLPVVRPRETPCYLCMLCPPACPTGALQPITDREEVRMGHAVVDESACYAFQGILCRTCIDECPLTETAIAQYGRLEPVVAEGCVGCGICERFCPAERPAITVRPVEAHAA